MIGLLLLVLYVAIPSKMELSVAMPPYKRYVDDFIELAAAIRGEAKLRVTYEENLLVQEILLRASGM